MAHRDRHSAVRQPSSQQRGRVHNENRSPRTPAHSVSHSRRSSSQSRRSSSHSRRSSSNSRRSSSDKRAHSNSDNEMEERPQKKKARQKHRDDDDSDDDAAKVKNETYSNWGRVICRLFEPYAYIKELVRMGYIEKDDEEDERTLRLINTYEAVCSFLPGFEEACALDTAERALFIAKVKAGHQGARGDDTALLTGTNWRILRMLEEEFPRTHFSITNMHKEQLGFNNNTTGSLLCPYQWDWYDDEVRQGLRAGTLIPSATNWPNLFYHGYSIDPEDDPFTGFLQSSLLVMVFKCIYTGPESWYTKDKDAATKAHKLDMMGVTQVTPAMVAYAATHAYQALSSASQHKKNSSTFPLADMYHSICDLLTNEELEEDAEEILTWWNAQIFPNGPRARKAAPVEDATDSYAHMLAYRRNQRKALADATADQNRGEESNEQVE